MDVAYEIIDHGIAVTLDGREARITYPEEIWRPFPGKHEFAIELVFLLTYGAALGSSDPAIRYRFPRPQFIDTYDRWFATTIPYLADTFNLDPDTLARDRAQLERVFQQATPGRSPALYFSADTLPSRAILSLTMGKDSLASLVVAREMKLEVVGVHCQHPSLSDDFRIRVPAMLALGEELGIAMQSVIDDVKALSIKADAPKHPSGILSSMSIAGYCLLLLPFAAFHRARYLLVGNEHELNHPIRSTRSGELVTLSPLQTIAGMSELDHWIGELTSGAVRLTSPIHALHRMAGHKLIHHVRPHVGVHQISCRKASADRRWCAGCKTCAENSLFIAAVGRDPEHLGLSRMFGQDHQDHFSIVSHGLDPRDPYRFLLAEQELLAFAAIAPTGEDTWMQRLVRQRHGARLEADRERLERTYLNPVGPPSSLPLAAEALACTRRLLATG